MANGSAAVVEQSAHEFKSEGSNPVASDTGREKTAKKVLEI